jgi:hypothetical protein
MRFDSPKRRAVRQRSGYTVSGETTGSEAQLLYTEMLRVSGNSLRIDVENEDAELVPQFREEVGMVAVGGYVYIDREMSLALDLKARETDDGRLVEEGTREQELTEGQWNKFGLSIEIEDPRSHLFVNLASSISLFAESGEELGKVHFHGVTCDVVDEYDSETVVDLFEVDNENEKTTRENFESRTSLYYPEIFYWKHVEPFEQAYEVGSGDVEGRSQGRQIVVKACNRCSRFLPASLQDERNKLGFSNHCVKRAPCTHGAFSQFSIENAETLIEKLEPGERPFCDARLVDKVVEGNSRPMLEAHYGFQLECRPCKKFFVNAPLNPLRNSAQRREDGLRRRAIEALLRELLEEDWIFYKFRRQEREVEFDRYIWEKFDRQCFACGKHLSSPKEMDLDHTLPLVYLWPLDEGATCLCSSCNSSKHDSFPFEFEKYKSSGKLEELAEKTATHEDVILSRERRVNPRAVDALREKISWVFDDFLMRDRYQKLRDGKVAASLIVDSIQPVLNSSTDMDLVAEYQNQTGSFPEALSARQSSGES